MVDTIKVIVADDHPYEVTGIMDLLSYAEGIQVIERATSPLKAVKLVLEHTPDVILLDMVWYQNRDEGLKAIRRIKEGAPKTRILVMSAYDEMLEPAKQAGADIAIHKDFLNSKQAFIDRIWDAYEVGRLPVPENHIVEDLTKREWEVLACICNSMSNKEIGEHLHISPKTVKRHASNIYGKLGVKNRVEATNYIHQHGIRLSNEKG